MDDNPAPQRGTTQPLHASQLVQNATPQPTQLSQPTHNSSTQPISQHLVQPTQAQQSTLNPTSNSFVPTQSVAGHTTATELLSDATRTPQCLLKTAIATVRVHNTCVSANILFDEGAQRSFVTEALATQLGADPFRTENLSISSFGGL